jgi:hypothetical protein
VRREERGERRHAGTTRRLHLTLLPLPSVVTYSFGFLVSAISVGVIVVVVSIAIVVPTTALSLLIVCRR